MAKSITVATTHGEFKVGEVLTREPAMAAYFMGMLNALGDKETTLAVPEIVRAINDINTDGMSPDEAETAIIVKLQAREAGQDDDEEEGGTAQIIDQDTANKRRGTAQREASKLNGEFGKHVLAILKAKAMVAKGPFIVADDVAAKWAKDTILDMPYPGSKLRKEDKDNPAKANMIYDHYKVMISGEYVTGSWFDDVFAATPTGQAMLAAIKTTEDTLAKAADGKLDAASKTLKKDYNDAVALLRRGVVINRTVWACESGLPNLVFQVQRDPDGTPQDTRYPVAVWLKSAVGTVKALTLSQFLSLDKPTGDDQLTGIERTIAKGGTLDALLQHGLPKKKNKGKNKAISIGTPDDAYDFLFKFGNYLEGGGAAAIAKMVRGPKADDWKIRIGDVVAFLAPLHDATAYEALTKSPALDKAKASKAKAA